MLAHIVRVFGPSPEQRRAQVLYVRVVDQARQPMFYVRLGVPDTLDGRFELILLHLFLLLNRLKQDEGTQGLRRHLMEAFFEDMDRSVREMGVSDTGVGKRVKKMALAFYGRMEAYTRTLPDRRALGEALQRNLYGTVEVDDILLSRMTDYVLKNAEALAKVSLAEMRQGRVKFAGLQHDGDRKIAFHKVRVAAGE